MNTADPLFFSSPQRFRMKPTAQRYHIRFSASNIKKESTGLKVNLLA